MAWRPITIGDALRSAAAAAPDRPFVIEAEEAKRRYSYREFDSLVDDLAAGLLTLGVGRGDLVTLWMTNKPEWALVWLATARIGAAVAPINTRYKTEEAAYIARQSQAKLMVAMDRYWDIDYLAMIREMRADLPDLEHVAIWGADEHEGMLSLDALIAKGRAARQADPKPLADAIAAVSPDDRLIIVYTSGTTGQPKGAAHSHVTLRNAENMARWLHVDDGDVLLAHMPFYHVAGAIGAVEMALLRAGVLVTMSQWEPKAAIDAIVAERVNIMGGIPTHFIDLIDQQKIEAVDTSCLKSAWIGGADVTPAVAQAAHDLLGLDALMAVYGMTETSACTTLARFEDPLEVTCDNRGLPVGEFEVRVVDVSTRAPLPVGEEGEVCVRGHIVMLEYYRDPAATAEAIDAEGWFKTGDLGRFDAEGYLKITGRAKEMFIVGGSNAYPAEIEKAIQTHPAVKQAVVVGAPHPRLGEVGHAFVQLDEGLTAEAGEIVAWCKARLADYKVPRAVKFVDDFPRTATGKIQRFVLAEQTAPSAG